MAASFGSARRRRPRWIEVRTPAAAEGERYGHSGIVLDVTDAWILERRLTTRDAVTRILASAVSRESACEGILREVGQALEWRAGVFWELDRQSKSLRAGAIWLASPGMAQFEAAIKASVFTPGLGLPGRVWSGREPAWINGRHAR